MNLRSRGGGGEFEFPCLQYSSAFPQASALNPEDNFLGLHDKGKRGAGADCSVLSRLRDAIGPWLREPCISLGPQGLR